MTIDEDSMCIVPLKLVRAMASIAYFYDSDGNHVDERILEDIHRLAQMDMEDDEHACAEYVYLQSRTPIGIPFTHEKDKSEHDHDIKTREWQLKLLREKPKFWPRAYLAFKSGPCHYLNCKHDAECDKCEFGELRMYAAQDSDHIHELHEKVSDMADQLKRIKRAFEPVLKVGEFVEDGHMAIQAVREANRRYMKEVL